MSAPTAAAATAMAQAASKKGLGFGLPYLTMTSANPYAPVGKWLVGTAGMVVGMIHVGGVTRMTQSGLSMTDWTPLGGLPPISEQEWQTEFERYKQFPEYEQRKSMTLSEFKYIYWWEYGHRMMGRAVGLVFFVPWAGFTLAKKIPPGYQPRMMGLFAMGGTQGLVGWWMVKSGLGDDRRGDRKEIRVRPTRLASHLTMAVITFSALQWTAMDVFSLPYKKDASMSNVISNLNKDALRQAARFRQGAMLLTGLTGVSIVTGALVAGNDAGRAYNTYPKMGDEWFPASEYWTMTPSYQNLIENTATVQFNHRVVAESTAVVALSLAYFGLTKRPAALTPQAQTGLKYVAAAAAGQAALGIATLLTYVPLPLAAAHQVGSIAVLSSSLYLTHSLRYASAKVARPVAAAFTNAATKVGAKAM